MFNTFKKNRSEFRHIEMDVTWTWKLPILLIVTFPELSCDVLRFGAKSQDNSSCSNYSVYTTCSIENESNCNEGSRHGLNSLGRFPHDVRCTGQRPSLDEMEFTNNFNTCPANKSVGNFPRDGIISGITGTTTMEPDLGYTIVLDILGACFNVTVIEVNGERIDYSKMIKKLKFDVKLEETNQSELYENYHSDMMIFLFPSEFVVKISENNTRLFNVTAVTHNGFCDWVGEWGEDEGEDDDDEEDYEFAAGEDDGDDEEEEEGGGKGSVKLAIWLQNLTVFKFIELVFIIGTLWWNFLSLMFWLIRMLVQPRQRVAAHVPLATAG